MTPTNDLFKLIQSLSANEKRYFKLYAQHQVNGKYKTQYEKLFDAINSFSEGEYDEAIFKKKNRGKVFLKNFAVQKKELYELLLRVLRNIQAYNDFGDTLSGQLLSEINFLISKGLHTQALKIVYQGKEMAEYREDWIMAMKFHQFHNVIGPFDIDNNSTVFTGVYLKESEYLKKQSYLSNVRVLRRKMFSWQTSSDLEKNRAEAQQVLKQLKVYYDDSFTPGLARIFCVLSFYQYYFNTMQVQKCIDVLTAHLQEKETGIFDGIYSPSIYGVVLANLLNAAAVAGNWPLHADAIKQYKTLKGVNLNQESEFAWVLCDAELHQVINTKNFSQANLVIGNAANCLEKYDYYLSVLEKVYMHINTGLLQMHRSYCTEAYGFFLTGFSLLEKEERRYYLRGLVRMLMFLAKVGSGQFDELDNELRSLKRFFKQSELQHNFYEHLYMVFKTIIKEGSIKSKKVGALIETLQMKECPAEYNEIKKILKMWM